MNWFFNIFTPKIVSNAALPDDRPQEQKDKDYSTQEITTSAVAPFQNEKIKKLTATVYNQWYVGDCVPHGFYTQLEYEGIAPKGMSQLRAYRKRPNYPNSGSNGVSTYTQIKSGQSNDFPTPDKFREADATAMPLIVGTKIIPEFSYFQYIDQSGNILVPDAVKDVAVGNAVSIFVYATDKEWSQEYVDIQDPNLSIGNAEVRHCICIIPKGDFTENGKQWLSVHDSAKFGGRHLRYISYEFLLKRCYFAAKVYKTEAIPVPPVPPSETPLPLTACKQGDSGAHVTNLQRYLIKSGCLESQYATGYYGPITSKAVLWWQLLHHEKFTSNIPELLGLMGKSWGEQSIKVVKIIEA